MQADERVIILGEDRAPSALSRDDGLESVRSPQQSVIDTAMMELGHCRRKSRGLHGDARSADHGRDSRSTTSCSAADHVTQDAERISSSITNGDVELTMVDPHR